MKKLLAVCVIGYLVWVGTLFFGLVYLDDNVLVGAKNVFEAIAEVGGGYFYRPIPALSYMVNAAAGGGSPFGYHLVNVALHLAAGVLVYTLLETLMATEATPQDTDKTPLNTGALIGALIFLVHPIATQAVAWIPGRNEILLAIFVLLTLITLIKTANYTAVKLLLIAVFYALALFTKETAVLIPILGLTLIATALHTPKYTDKKSVLIGVLLSAYIGVTLVWFLMRQSVIEHPFTLLNTLLNTDETLITTANSMITVFLGSLGKLVFPVNLSTYPIVGESFLPMGLIGLISLIGLMGLMRRMGPMGRMGVVWVLLFTAASVVRPNIGDPQAEVLEHRLYLPLIGFTTLIVTALQLLKTAHARVAVISSLVAVLAVLSLINQQHYRDGMSYWQRAVATTPQSAFAHKQLGVMYYLMKQFDQAKQEYEAALAINPNEPLVHNNIGVILMGEGKFGQARDEFTEELRVNPGYENAIENLKMVQLQENGNRK